MQELDLRVGPAPDSAPDLGENIDYKGGTTVTARKVDLRAPLGMYYLDLSSTFVDYHEYRYGEFDASGVPMVGRGVSAYYSPVNIAQYGFILLDHYHQHGGNSVRELLLRLLAWFEENRVSSNGETWWVNPKADYKYNLPAGFVSSMALGEVMSFYLRMYELMKDETLLSRSEETFKYLQKDFSDGGVRRLDKEGNLWFEEYPTEPPSYVLNGFIYTYYGILDLYRMTGDSKVERDLRACEKTLRENIVRYDCGYWSVYDQLKKELVMVYYQKNVHVPLLRSLAGITGDEVYSHYADKWEGQLTPFNIAFVKLMYRVRPRLQRWFGIDL